MPGNNAQSLFTNAAFLASARLLPRLLQSGYMIFLARRLGPELYGLFVYGQSWYLSLLPLTSFGIYLLLSKTIGTNPAAAPGALAYTLAFRVGVATAAALLSAGAAYFCEPDPIARVLLFVFSLALLGRAIVIWTEHAFIAFESAHYALRSELYFRLIESGVGILLLVWGSKVLPIAILHALVWWLQAIAALRIIHRRLAPVGLHCTWQRARELLVSGWPLSLNIFCIGFLLQGPMVLYRSLAPSELHIGQMAVPLQAFALLAILPTAVSGAALPVLARLGRSSSGEDVRVTQTMIRLGYGFGAVVGLIGLALGSWLVKGILGVRYTMAGEFIGPALWLVIPYTCGSVLTSLALVQGRIRPAVMCSAGGALALVAAVPLLTGWWENAGVIVATAVALSCWVGLLLAMGAGNLTVCVIRPMSWVCIALATYIIVVPHSTLLALGSSLLILLCSAPLLGIVQPNELQAIRQRYGF
jgi:O-antigen/teichoic acid export membrane protein